MLRIEICHLYPTLSLYKYFCKISKSLLIPFFPKFLNSFLRDELLLYITICQLAFEAMLSMHMLSLTRSLRSLRSLRSYIIKIGCLFFIQRMYNFQTTGVYFLYNGCIIFRQQIRLSNLDIQNNQVHKQQYLYWMSYN